MVSIAASPDGKFVYTSDLDGRLCCIHASQHMLVAEWKPEDAATAGGNHEPAILTSLSANIFSDDTYLITSVDNSGVSSVHNLYILIYQVYYFSSTLQARFHNKQ